MIAVTLFTLVDNGFVLTGSLAAYGYSFMGRQPENLASLNAELVLLIVTLMLPLSMALTWFWLKMAEWTAQRYQLVAAKPAPVERSSDAQPHLTSIRQSYPHGD